MVVCSLCKHDGHLKKDCPEDFKKVQLDPLPALTPEFLCVLNKVCEQCYSGYQFVRQAVSTLKSLPRAPIMVFYCSFYPLVFICFSFFSFLSC